MKVGLPHFKVESLGSNRYNRGVKQYGAATREVVSSEAHLTANPDEMGWTGIRGICINARFHVSIPIPALPAEKA